MKSKSPFTHLAKLTEERLLRVCIVFFFPPKKTKNGNKTLKRTSLGFTRMSMKSPEPRKWEARGKEEGTGGGED